MADNKNNKYKLNVYNTITKKYDEVEVSEELYNVYRRTGWNIENNDKRYFDHGIQMSSLIGGGELYEIILKIFLVFLESSLFYPVLS